MKFILLYKMNIFQHIILYSLNDIWSQNKLPITFFIYLHFTSKTATLWTTTTYIIYYIRNSSISYYYTTPSPWHGYITRWLEYYKSNHIAVLTFQTREFIVMRADILWFRIYRGISVNQGHEKDEINIFIEIFRIDTTKENKNRSLNEIGLFN